MCLRNVLAERQGRWETNPLISIHHRLGLLQGWTFLSVSDLFSEQAHSQQKLSDREPWVLAA